MALHGPSQYFFNGKCLFHLQDVQYADIDHYDERKIFTIDPVNYDGLKEYFSELREGGMHTIIILVRNQYL